MFYVFFRFNGWFSKQKHFILAGKLQLQYNFHKVFLSNWWNFYGNNYTSTVLDMYVYNTMSQHTCFEPRTCIINSTENGLKFWTWLWYFIAIYFIFHGMIAEFRRLFDHLLFSDKVSIPTDYEFVLGKYPFMGQKMC